MSDLGKDFEDEKDLGAEFDAEPEHDDSEAHAEPATDEDVRQAQATTAPQTFAHRLVGNTPLGPQASAAIRALGSQLHGSPMSFGEDYRQARTEFDRDSDAGSKAHPTAGAFGSGVGLANSLALPMGSGLKGAAGAGVLFGAGDAVDAASKGNTGEALATVPASIAASMALHGISAPIAKFISDKLGSAAGRLAFRAAGPMLNDVRKVGSASVADVGNKLLDSGAVAPLGTAESISERLGPVRKQTGEYIGNAKSMFDRLGAKWFPEDVAQRIESEVVSPLTSSGVAEDKALAERAQAAANELRARGNQPRPLSELAGIRERFDAHHEAAYSQKNKPLADVFKDIRGTLDRAFDEEAEATSPELAKRYNELQGDYAVFKPAEKMADDQANRQAANRLLSLGDRVGGGAVGALAGYATGDDSDRGIGSVLGGMAGAMGGRLMRTRGASTLAVAARGASRGLSRLASNPAVMGRFAPALERALSERGEQGMLALHHAMVERDPHYRAQFAQAQESEDPE